MLKLLSSKSVFAFAIQVPTNGHWHQFNPNKNPQFGGVVKKETSFSAKQLKYQQSMSVGQLWGQAPLQLKGSTLCHTFYCTGLLHSRTICFPLLWSIWRDIQSVFQLSQVTQSSFFFEKGSTLSQPTGELAYMDISPCPWSLIGPSPCK